MSTERLCFNTFQKSFYSIFGILLMLAFFAGTPNRAEGSPYKLDQGDRISISAHEWPGLRTEVSVDLEGEISLPIIGNTKVKGYTTSLLSSLIASRLKKKAKLIKEPNVVVSIVKYRPFFIIGDVSRPGPYEYTPGMAVLQAVAIAGGHHRDPRRERDRYERDLIIYVNDYRDQKHTYLRSLVKSARIDAELAGLSSVSIDDIDSTYIDDKLVKKAVSIENRILSNNTTLLNQRLSTAAGLSKIATNELQSLEKELSLVEKQFLLVEKEAARIRNMLARALTNATRVLSVERALAGVQSERQELRDSTHKSPTRTAQIKTRDIANKVGKQTAPSRGT